MPDGSAYQYVTATLDLSLADGENLLVSDTDGQLLTTSPADRRHAAGETPSDDAPGISHSAPSYGLRYMRNPRYHSLHPVNDVLVVIPHPNGQRCACGCDLCCSSTRN